MSDIHLGAGDAKQAKRTEQAFCRWLDAIAKDATCIYLMGDIFDFWFEYSRVVPKGEHTEASWEKQIPIFLETLFYGL